MKFNDDFEKQFWCNQFEKNLNSATIEGAAEAADKILLEVQKRIATPEPEKKKPVKS